MFVPCLSLISISSYVVQGTKETGNINVMKLMLANGTTSVPKSVLRFVSGLRTSTSALDFFNLPCYPLLSLLFPNERSDK